jgi:FkbM family methyltransferase
MRDLIKGWAHCTVKIMEGVKGFAVPSELPLKTKIDFLFGLYETETSQFIRTHVKGGVAIDVGAHIGYYSRLLSPLVDTVYAFEPDPTNYAFLVKNVQRYANVIPVNMALSDTVGRQEFFRVQNSTFRHSLVDEGDTEKIMVQTTTLDEFLKKEKGVIIFVKIDVEGHEQSVLDGMKNIIEKHHPLIIAEMPINESYTAVSPAIGRKRSVRNYIRS